MPPEAADILKNTGFDALSIANNHTMDLGAEGLFQTLGNLDRVGIAHSGGGRNIQQARKPAILERKGVKLALLSYSSVFVPGTFPAGRDKPGIATVAVKTSYEIPDRLSYSPGLQPRVITIPSQKDVQQMTEDVRQAKAQADVVIVSCHWGFTKHANSGASSIPVEDSPLFVLNYQEDVGHAAIDAGADLIFGHHTFWLQGMEMYKGKLICYCLGRLSAPYTYVDPVLGNESVILKAYIDPGSKQLTRVTLIPVRIAVESQEPYIVTASEGLDIIRELERQSKKYGTKFLPEGEEIAVQQRH
jgi:poly-gamma-glutamate capsule biosynthesis protein CapA/YwtB (metallophosphatase superfamily)